MTLGDFLKRVDINNDKDKMLIYRDCDNSWCNVRVEIRDNEITILSDNELLFDD